MNYIVDYMLKSNSYYSYQNLANVYNMIYDIIKMDENKKDDILEIVKKNCGMSFMCSFQSYCIKKSLNIDF